MFSFFSLFENCIESQNKSIFKGVFNIIQCSGQKNKSNECIHNPTNERSLCLPLN